MSGAIAISRDDAIAKGIRLFSAEPCHLGHDGVRRVWAKSSVCVECRAMHTAKWRDENRNAHNAWGKRNPASRSASQKKYAKERPERCRAARLRWIAANKEQFRAQQRRMKKRLRAESEDWRLRQNLRGRLRKALTRASAAKSGKTLDLIGCTVPELKAHLERQFWPGMSWDNYGHGPDRWNVDHRIPCASFDLTDPAQQRACFHFSNLQPLWHVDNVAKGDRLLHAA